MDSNVLSIYGDDIELAQKLCSSISDNDTRSRAVANVLAVKLAERYFLSDGYTPDVGSGLHNIPSIVDSLDISDLYLNGTFIDVRVYFSEEELSVPKLHFDLGMVPSVYMFIKLDKDLSSYEVTGFIRPDYIDKNNLKDDYYYVREDDLSSLYDVESNFKTVYDVFDGSSEDLYSFVDGSIDENRIMELMKVLVASANARRTLIKAFKAKSVFKFVSVQDIEKAASASDEADNQEEAQDENNLIFTETESDTKEDADEDEDLLNALEYSTEVTPNELDLIDEANKSEAEENAEGEEQTQNDEQIDTLFTGEQEGIPVTKKKGSSVIMFLLFVVMASALGYYGYTKYAGQSENNNFSESSIPSAEEDVSLPQQDAKPKEDAMPNETVAVQNPVSARSEEVSSVAIPAIEQHLDASVLVSNLKVDWEVPAGYASNTSAKRYLIKLGKVIQLNLKSELLLLTKPPISNRITVELKFNPGRGKFEVVGITASSGEKMVDEVIENTIKNALNYSLSSNIESFGKLQGNPVLIIHL